MHLREQEECLSQFFDVTVVTASNCDYLKLCNAYKPDMSMLESGVYVGERNVKNVSAHPHIPKVGFIHCDAFCPTRKIAMNDMVRWGIETYFTHSVSLGSYTPSLEENLFVWPNFANPDIYHDYGLVRVIPVLFTGSQDVHYPWRNRINKVVSQHYPSLQCPHFGWGDSAERAKVRMLFGKQYARLISAALFAPACGTFANDIVRKHLEIPACGTCLITQRTPTVEAAGFVDLKNCVFADDHDVLDKLDWLFQRQEDLEEIKQAGRRLVDKHHTLRSRDQVYQWYCLNKRLEVGQKIVQCGPFLPLAIADQHGPSRNVHLLTHGIDRMLMAEGDEKLWKGKYDEAEALYRRCLNYYEMPEPRLRLALCALFKGHPKVAVEVLRQQVEWVLANGGSEPDVVEWAYLILALLCQGEKGEAMRRLGQFTSLRHTELDRVRGLVRVAFGRLGEVSSNAVSGALRASIHQLPQREMCEWVEGVKQMFRACGQQGLADRLGRANGASLLRWAMGDVSETWPRSAAAVAQRECERQKIQTTGRKYVTDPSTVQSWTYKNTARAKRHIKRLALLALRAMKLLLGDYIPYRWSAMIPDEDSIAIRNMLRVETIRTGLMIGSAAGAWLTEAFIAGIRENPNLPFGICMNHETSRRFRELQRRFEGDSRVLCRALAAEGLCFEQERNEVDIVLIDCSELLGGKSDLEVPSAQVLVLDDIQSECGSQLLKTLLAAPDYALHYHCLSPRKEYAILRRLPSRFISQTGFNVNEGSKQQFAHSFSDLSAPPSEHVHRRRNDVCGY